MSDQELKVVVTISAPVHVGVEEWRTHRTSRVFAISRSIADMLTWAKSCGFKNPTINDLEFSEYTGSSV